MRECWLKPNRRALACGLIAPALLLAAGSALGIGFWGHASLKFAAWAGWGLAAVGLAWGGVLAAQLFQPRLALAGADLLVYLGTPRPLAVPIDLVECFFLGHGPSGLPASGGQEPETTTIVVRIAESAAEYKHRHVKPALGNWCDGYIVIRGTWCEPISPDLMQRLNARLVDAHRRQKARGISQSSGSA